MTETLKAGAEYGADALIVCDNLVRIYQVENIEVQALQGLDLLVDKGEMIAIVGQSGSGKSTLLNVLSGLDVPTAGAARVAGWDLLRMSHADRLTYRRSVVGFVWQQTARNLLPYLTARENVMLPMAFSGMRGSKRVKRANELLEAMGMADKSHRKPYQMSGGEQQRVAIATALANSPEVIFADEPTGELDSATGDDVFEALRSANRDLGATVVVVTHDHAVSSQVQRTVAIRDGRTATEVVRRTHIGEDGQAQTLHEEYAVLDRAGRLQIPKDYREALGLKDRVRLDIEDDHLGVWADGTPRKKRPAPAPEAEAVADAGTSAVVGASSVAAPGAGGPAAAAPAPVTPPAVPSGLVTAPSTETFSPAADAFVPAAPASEEIFLPPAELVGEPAGAEPEPASVVEVAPVVESPSKPPMPIAPSAVTPPVAWSPAAAAPAAPTPQDTSPAATSPEDASPVAERREQSTTETDVPRMPWLPNGGLHD